MSGELIVHRNRTNRVSLGLGINVAGETITSQIRKEKDVSSDLIAEWTVSFLNDGTDGEVILTLPHTIAGAVTASYGWMDLKRVSGGQPISVFSEPLRVRFQGVVTA